MKKSTYTKRNGETGESITLEEGDHFVALEEATTTTFAGADYPSNSIKAEYTINKKTEKGYLKLTGNQYETMVVQAPVKGKTIETNTYTNDYGHQVGLRVVEKK